MALIRKPLTKSYWNNNFKADVFKVELFRVIPSFESDEAWNSVKTKIPKKTGKDHDLGKHLELIVKISKGEEENTLTDTDLSGMSEDEILMEFVKIDNSLTLASSDRAREEHKKRLQSVFEVVGTDLSTRSRYSSERTYANDVSDNEDDDSDGE